MKVVSLFSGCGGMDLGFEQAGFEIAMALDFDKFAAKTYNANFKKPLINEDLWEFDLEKIPDHDLMIAGFPCQPFSVMHEEEGFEDEERGTLFFKLCEIIDLKEPQIIVLENVRNLLRHDEGNTFKRIKDSLEEREYKVFHKVLNTSDYGLPQTRRRVFIVAFKDHSVNFTYPEPIELELTMQDLLEQDVPDKYYLSEKMIETVMSWGTKNYSAKPEIDLKIARTLCASMAKMHRASQDNYVSDERGIRRLTPRECARLQGFPEDFKIVCSDTQAYRQFGNAVSVPVAKFLANSIQEAVNRKLTATAQQITL